MLFNSVYMLNYNFVYKYIECIDNVETATLKKVLAEKQAIMGQEEQSLISQLVIGFDVRREDKVSNMVKWR